MKDGLKWSITGGIIGLLIVIVGAIVMSRISTRIDLKLDWIIGLSIPFITSILVWFVKMTDKRKESESKQIYEAIQKKADQVELDALAEKFDEHKDNNKQSYDLLFETIESMDKKLDILIGKK